ncbi:MAG: acetyl-CoA carboxylase biotin carboxylase subunit [Burkholderiaceae bacterium]|jgi:geranyl-CoA carboxylase alpha subunit|nr:acetyl-CoA carboxylase biotin carboxylase subunit [Burkholderiaceae bacterium]
MTAQIHAAGAASFHKILIANRGEIALRVIRSARALGYRTVAVYSTADAGARHMLDADQAVCIGEPLPAQSYLNIAAVIEAARRSGADAVHPGYGFLAENEDFAQACADAGLVFIGPPARAIAEMGNKANAKKLMQQAGVPCIPGYQGQDQTDERLIAEAERIGFPVMIKATAGGGGRGMRLAHSARAFPDLLRNARSEAQSAFGSSEVILERAIIEPRHIEIQVFADAYGNAIYLGERDCSVQRRHQKLIEEAPSPAVSPELRARMGATAVAAVKAIGYVGAGTLEFLLDREGNFYFMEMNTRLQVEHPVTEAITGLDLVEWQLRIAAGEPLPLAQDEVRLNGHAIEVRLCAEDADNGFMPQSGTMTLWQMPRHVRVEDALRSGAPVSAFYDSMLAKLIAHGTTRDQARRKLMAGLEDTVALGVTTNRAFLQCCLAHPVFSAGDATTAFIEQHLEALLAHDAGERERAAAVAAVLLDETVCRQRHGEFAHNLPIMQRFDLGGQSWNVEVAHDRRRRYTVALNGHTVGIEIIDIGESEVRLICDGVFEGAHYWRDGALMWFHYRGQTLCVQDRTRSASQRKVEADSDGKLRAAMNGRVVAVLAQVGQSVQVGQPIVTLEAMKMEHVHAAPVTGVLTALHVQVGEQVAASRVVAEIEMPSSGDAAPT